MMVAPLPDFADRYMMRLQQADTSTAIAMVRDLFQEYAQALNIDLGFQDFTTELAILPGEYISPRGRLLLGLVDDIGAGCVAMRPVNETICEMKRLYVRPLFRANGIGRKLVEQMIVEARMIGYCHIYLDTRRP